MDADRLVFLDESGAKTNFTRLRGRCPAGERLVCKAPAGHWSTTTMIAAICLTGAIAGAVIKGAMDGEVFSVWVTEALLPGLKPGDIVVMDNLPAHKKTGGAKDDRGCRVRGFGFCRHTHPTSIQSR